MKNYIILFSLLCAYSYTPLHAVIGEEEYMMGAEESIEPSGATEEGYMQFQEETDADQQLPSYNEMKMPTQEEDEINFDEMDME